MKRVNKSTSRVQSDRKGNDDRVVLCTLCIRAFEVGLRYECMKIVRLFLGIGARVATMAFLASGTIA